MVATDVDPIAALPSIHCFRPGTARCGYWRRALIRPLSWPSVKQLASTH